MRREDRAKQFLPFDAMKGLSEALRAREEKLSRVEKIELSEDMAEELSKALARIEKGSRIVVNFYYSGHYLKLEGTVASKNDTARYLIMGTERIYYDDILEIQFVSQ